MIFSDFRWNGIPGVKIITPLTVGGLLLCLWFFLNKTKYGIAMRAMAEDEKLAAALGVNIDLLHIATWFLSGSLAGLAGSIISMWAMTSVDFSDSLLVNVMAGSVVGGLSSITGAIFGGFFIAFSKVVLTWGLVRLFGVGMYDWSQFLPMIFMFLVLSIEPDGIIAMKGKSLTIHSVKEAYIRLKRALFNVFSSE
jgi:branched-chain amino acid transport system permease protein